MTNQRKDGNTAAKDEARTPPEIFGKLDEEFGFDCDAAANKQNALCKWYLGEDYTGRKEDSLIIDWGHTLFQDGLTQNYCKSFWVNPPYSNGNIMKFVEKAWLESGNGATVVLLIPSDPSTQYFDFCFENASEIRFMQPRVKFNNPDETPMKSSPPMGSMIVVFRPGEEGPARLSIWRWKTR